MLRLFLFFLLSLNLFSEKYLKGILFDGKKFFVQEYEDIKGFDSSIFKINEGFVIYYPNGKPPVIYKFKGNNFEKIYEPGNLKKVKFIPKDCEYQEKLKGMFKISPEKEWKDFPFDKKYNFILSLGSEFLYLKDEKYFIEEIKGKYFNPNFLPIEFFSNAIFYPSFKTKFLIEDEKGQLFDKCKVSINYNTDAYGKLCGKLSVLEMVEGNGFYYNFPLKGSLNLRVFCQGGKSYFKKIKTEEIGNPFIIDIKRLGQIEGKVEDSKENPVESLNLKLFRDGEIIPLKETTTDKKGYFKFSDLEEGKYKIKDSEELFEPQTGKNLTLKTKGRGSFFFSGGDLNIIGRDEPKGIYVNEIYELGSGENAFLKITIDEVMVWEGVVISSLGKPIEGVEISSNLRTLASTNADGKFKVEFRGKILKGVNVKASGYASLYLKEVDLEDPPETLVLKGEGKFKVAIISSPEEIEKVFPNISISFLSEEKLVNANYGFYSESEEIIIESELPEGEYRFKIEGKPFKKFISKPFFIEEGKEYDYGSIRLELEEEQEESVERKILITLRDFKGNPAPNTKVSIKTTSLINDKSASFYLTPVSNEDGLVIFKPLYSEFFYNYIYADGDLGFLMMEAEELVNYSNLDNFELFLNPPNELIVKILNLKSNNKLKIILRSKYSTILDEISLKEEKKFKNLFSPQEIEIWDGNEILWKETIYLNSGKNELIL